MQRHVFFVELCSEDYSEFQQRQGVLPWSEILNRDSGKAKASEWDISQSDSLKYQSAYVQAITFAVFY